MSRIRLLFAWLVLAALPLQGFAAATMLFCGTGPQHHAAAQAAAGEHHDHSVHGHGDGHAHAMSAAADTLQAAEPVDAVDAAVRLPDPGHTCGVCASCCHGLALAETPRLEAAAPLPQAIAAEPFVRVHARASPVPDKPPRT